MSSPGEATEPHSRLLRCSLNRAFAGELLPVPTRTASKSF